MANAAKSTDELARIIRQLQAERQQHADAIAAIDEQFEQHGIAAEPRKKRRGRRRGPGRPKGSMIRKVGKKKRRTFSKTADEFILDLLKGRSMTTGEINAKWRQTKRGGNADTTLSRLSARRS